MKLAFCDESGVGGEQEKILVFSAFIIDAYRYPKAVRELKTISSKIEDRLGGKELKFSAVRRKAGECEDTKCLLRELVTVAVNYRFACSVVDLEGYESFLQRVSDVKSKNFLSEKPRGLHLAAADVVVQIVRNFEREKRNKGVTFFIIDRLPPDQDTTVGKILLEEKRPQIVMDLLESSVSKRPKHQGKSRAGQSAIDEVIMEGLLTIDSKHSYMVRVADICSGLVRAYVCLKMGRTQEKWVGEEEWISELAGLVFDRLLYGKPLYRDRDRRYPFIDLTSVFRSK